MADDRSGKIPPEEYEQLFLYLPNIETIRLQYFPLRYYHLQQIAKLSVLLKHVKEISPLTYTWVPEELQVFYNCASAFKNSLQRMALLASSTTVLSTDDTFGNIISFLPDFISLTSLEIINWDDSNPMNLPPLIMFSILRSCPNLVRFRLENDFEEPEDDHNYSFDHSKLRYMDITVPQINQSHVNYMVSNINGLKQLKVKIGFRFGFFARPNPVQWLEEIGPEYSTRFQKYLSGIEDVDFSMGENFIMNSTDYWSFGNSVINKSKSTKVDISLKLIDLIDYPHERKTVLVKRADNISFHCGVDINELISMEHRFDMQLFLHTFITPTHMIADRIQSLDIEFKLNDEKIIIMHDFRLNVFESIMDRFSNIYKLNTKIGFSPSVAFQIQLFSYEFDYHEEYDPVDTVLTHRLVIESNKQAYVTLRNLQSTHEITSILNKVSNTKHLVLLGCYLTANAQFNYTLDMRHLHLKHLTLDITKLAIQGQGEKTFVLKIEQKKSNQTAYFKWKRVDMNYTEMIFEPVDKRTITRQRRVLPNFNVITIRVQKVERLTLCSKGGLVITTLIFG